MKRLCLGWVLTHLLAGHLATAQPAPIAGVDPWNLASPACETIEDLNPTGPLYDMVDWTTPDADIRSTSHMSSERGDANGPYGGAYVLQTLVTQDSITYLKTPNGDTWDKNLVDDLGIWSFRTETHWGTPHSFTQFRNSHAILSVPRRGRGGYPGMRWLNCDSAFANHESCGMPATYGHLGYVIHELHGPFYFDPGYGDVRGVDVLKIVYFYACSAPDSGSCAAAEVSWTTKRYGQIAWRLYERRPEGWVLTAAPPITVYVVPGVITESFPCDSVVP